jgi:hypothetical protein
VVADERDGDLGEVLRVELLAPAVGLGARPSGGVRAVGVGGAGDGIEDEDHEAVAVFELVVFEQRIRGHGPAGGPTGAR